MKTVGIVAEYNPFHLGHAYQLVEAKRQASADAVVVCMGGNFTQRGEYTVINKFSRAEMALCGGADLVIELPVSFAVSSAERFAFGGVSLLSGIADSLSFGAECSDKALLEAVASEVSSEPFLQKVISAMEDGSSFAMAREKVLKSEFPESAGILSSPNNILAVEYIKALKKCGSPMKIFPIPRIGASHGALEVRDDFASASAIRRMPLESAAQYLPPEAFAILKHEKEEGRLMTNPDLWDAAMLASLRKQSKSDLASLPDISEGLENRLYEAIHSEISVENIISKANSRRYPSSRIRRALMQAFLGITSVEIFASPSPLYIRVLAFNDIGRKLLASLRNSGSSLPILARGGAYRSLPEDAAMMFSREVIADDIYTSLYPEKGARKAFSDLYCSPIHIE